MTKRVYIYSYSNNNSIPCLITGHMPRIAQLQHNQLNFDDLWLEKKEGTYMQCALSKINWHYKAQLCSLYISYSFSHMPMIHFLLCTQIASVCCKPCLPNIVFFLTLLVILWVFFSTLLVIITHLHESSVYTGDRVCLWSWDPVIEYTTNSAAQF